MSEEIEQLTGQFSMSCKELCNITIKNRDLQNKFDQYYKKSEEYIKDREQHIQDLNAELADVKEQYASFDVRFKAKQKETDDFKARYDKIDDEC